MARPLQRPSSALLLILMYETADWHSNPLTNAYYNVDSLSTAENATYIALCLRLNFP